MGKETEENQDNAGINTSQTRLVRWQQQAEWRRTGINFAETYWKRRPNEDIILREEEVGIGHTEIRLSKSVWSSCDSAGLY